jgi:hypothetical protein
VHWILEVCICFRGIGEEVYDCLSYISVSYSVKERICGVLDGVTNKFTDLSF